MLFFITCYKKIVIHSFISLASYYIYKVCSYPVGLSIQLIRTSMSPLCSAPSNSWYLRRKKDRWYSIPSLSCLPQATTLPNFEKKTCFLPIKNESCLHSDMIHPSQSRAFSFRPVNSGPMAIMVTVVFQQPGNFINPLDFGISCYETIHIPGIQCWAKTFQDSKTAWI